MTESRDSETKLIRTQAIAPTTLVRARRHATWSDDAGSHEVSLDGRVIVGSASAARVHVADRTVSRLHAELEVRDDGIWIHDLGSRNGCFVEGVQVSSARVPDGGQVRVGETTIVIDIESRSTVVDLWQQPRFGPLLGGSAVMRELFAQLAKVATNDSSVLIHGETGTGKDLVARAIHDASARAKHPFIIVDCGALPEPLVESELFGHVKGAFTGAATTRAGAVEAANGGTLFLDEIGELPLSMQPKLLRVLESRSFRRVGEAAHRPCDVRFLSATHRDLASMVNAGAFREDLYFRLAVIPIVVPPLRQRPDDVDPLVRHFLSELGAADVSGFGRDFRRALADRPWPGNVRELRNFVERALVLGPDEALTLTRSDPGAAKKRNGSAQTSVPPDVERAAPPPSVAGGALGGRPPIIDPDIPYKDLRDDWLDHLEREYLRVLLDKHRRNVTAMAQAAGLDRTYIYRLIRKHGV